MGSLILRPLGGGSNRQFISGADIRYGGCKECHLLSRRPLLHSSGCSPLPDRLAARKPTREKTCTSVYIYWGEWAVTLASGTCLNDRQHRSLAAILLANATHFVQDALLTPQDHHLQNFISETVCKKLRKKIGFLNAHQTKGHCSLLEHTFGSYANLSTQFQCHSTKNVLYLYMGTLYRLFALQCMSMSPSKTPQSEFQHK